MASYQKRQTKTKGQVWDVIFRINENGEEVQKKLSGFPTKKAAQTAYEHYIEGQTSTQSYQITTQSKSTTSFVNAFNRYMACMNGLLRQWSLDTIYKRFKRYIIPNFSSKQIDQITRHDIIQWVECVWNLKNKKGELLSQYTCISIFRVFHTFVKWATEEYSLSTNPFEGVKTPRRREQKKERTVWTAEDFCVFLKNVADQKYKVFFSLLFFTGCREGEINALTVDDFIKENENYTIKISKTLYHRGKGKIVNPPKTATSNRTVSLPKGLTPILDNFFEGKSGLLWGKDDATLHYMFHSALNKTNLPRIRIHDLRHSHASILIAAGIPITTVSKRLGHSSTEITLDVYAHCLDSSEEDIIDLFNKTPLK